MDTSLSEEIAEKSLSAKSTAETETGDQTEQDDPKLPAKAEHRAERIKSSVARLTSSSINELEGLTSELNALQEFLKSETDRVQREVESALAGLRIIIETISPWKSIQASVATPRREGLNGLKGNKRLSEGTN
jgi:hypothetical protein